MKEARYFYVPNAAALNELPAEEAVHALRVLRLKEGDEMFLMDGEGNFYQAEVVLATAKKCVYTIRQTMRQKPAWSDSSCHCPYERHGTHGMDGRESHGSGF